MPQSYQAHSPCQHTPPLHTASPLPKPLAASAHCMASPHVIRLPSRQHLSRTHVTNNALSCPSPRYIPPICSGLRTGTLTSRRVKDLRRKQRGSLSVFRAYFGLSLCLTYAQSVTSSNSTLAPPSVTQTRSLFGTYLSQLRSNELIEVRNGRIKASENLFV